ncbi:hypothetical protein Hanom_Chr16g01426381 [Helianthus anomalus]
MDNSDNGCWIVTEIRKRIEEEANIEWCGKLYKVWVNEELNPWLQNAVMELTEERKVSPTKSSESVVAPEEEVEEGEIQDGGTGEENMEGRPRELELSTPCKSCIGIMIGGVNVAAEGLGKGKFGDSGGTRVDHHVNNNCGEYTLGVGQRPGTKSRKRSRKVRSPQYWGPNEGVW